MKPSTSASDADTAAERLTDSAAGFVEGRSAVDRRRPARLFVALAAAIGGGLLIALAVPRLFAAIELLDARSIAERAQVDDPKLSNQQLDEATSALQHALAWQDDADMAALLAMARLRQAGRANTPERGAERLKQASEAAKRAIRLSPAHPTAWTLLAMSLEAADPAQPLFIATLQRAVAVATYDPRYLAQRVEMACRYWHLIDAPTRHLASAQIHILAGRDLRVLAMLTRRSYGLQPVRDALSDDPDLLERFDALYVTLP
jgi:tetratricopeptide (TPR) repeat protein